MRVAIYARVSTDRQERMQTIDSQLTALSEWVTAQGHELRPEHIYRDEGASGAHLDRPGLDRLRDAARNGDFELVGVLSPDRLARKYAYQVLLLEEFRRLGCAVVFLQRPISDDPHDQLLLQIQGALAEYERTVISERFRRGKLQRARAGVYLGGKAPYGYRYVPKRDDCPGHLLIDETEAALVRTLFPWLIEDQLTIRQLIKRLNRSAWQPRSGRRPWSPAVIHHILADPLYTGTAYVNRYHYVPPQKPRTPYPAKTDKTCRRLRPREEWMAVPVPALIDQATYDRAQAQLARNARLSFRHNTKYSYLLRCLLTCGLCGLAMFGRTHPAAPAHRRYYLCHGKDALLSARAQSCPRRAIKAEELERVVWAHVTQLLSDPRQLLAQFQQFAQFTGAEEAQAQAEARRWALRRERLAREEARLLDAYQAEVITLAELAQRRQQLAQRRQALHEQHAQQERLWRNRLHAQEVLEDLTAFCDRIQSRLAEATFADKQAILQLLIERIIVGEETLEIRHVIPLRGLPPSPGDANTFNVPLCSDGVIPTPLLRQGGVLFSQCGP
jgi:site-specific DNA recombinase